MECGTNSASFALDRIRCPARKHLSLSTLSVLLAILLAPGPLLADTAGWSIELLSPALVEPGAHRMVAASVNLINNAAEVHEYTIDIEVPAGWTCTASPSTLTLNPGESDVVFISIAVPSVAAAGDYAVRINACPDGMESRTMSVEMTIRVPAVTRLEVLPSRPAQPAATTGDILEQGFQIVNRGNAPSRVAVEIVSVPDWPSAVDPPNPVFDLGPGEAGAVRVTVVVPDELARSVMYRLTVIARAVDEGRVTEARVSTTTHVVPERLSVESVYATLDGDMSMVGAWGDDEDFATVFSLGPLQGDLGEGRTARLALRNLLLEGDTSSTFIQSERISAEYIDETAGHIRGGDLLFDLGTPLMARNALGRGGDALSRGDDADFRAFYYRTRGSLPTENAGAQVAHLFGDTAAIRLTGICDSPLPRPGQVDGEEGGPSTTFGLFAGFEPFEGADLSGEIGRTRGPDPGSGSAWRVTGNLSTDRFSVNSEWLHAGEAFHGGWQDIELRRANLLWRLSDELSIWSSLSHSWNNVSGDPDEQERNHRNVGFGAAWNIEDLARLRVSHRSYQSWDPMLGEFDRHTDLTVYSLSRNWDGLSATASWENEVEDSRIAQERQENRALRLDCAARLGNSGSVRLGYSSGTVSYDPGADSFRTRFLGLGGYLWLAEDVDLSLNVQRNTGGLLGSRTNVLGALTWEFVRDHELSLRLRSYTGTFDTNTELAVELTQPVTVRLGAFPVRGSVEGRLFKTMDPETGVGGAIISLGEWEVRTDERGHFRFPSVEPGEYELAVDPESLGVGLTPAVDMPLMLAVESGSTTEVEVPIVETGAVAGCVVLETPEWRDRTLSIKAMADLVVELRREDTTEYRFTDNRGQFLFSDLKPGRYVITLRSENLPRFHEITGPQSYEFELAPGQSLSGMDFVICPAVRRIVITTDGTEQE